MEEQIKEQYEKAFWDLLDNDPPNIQHVEKILDEIKQILYSFVPNREFQTKLMVWAERLQAPIYDQITQSWKRKLPQKLSEFLKNYYEHLSTIRKGIAEHHKKPSGSGITMRTGR